MQQTPESSVQLAPSDIPSHNPDWHGTHVSGSKGSDAFKTRSQLPRTSWFSQMLSSKSLSSLHGAFTFGSAGTEVSVRNSSTMQTCEVCVWVCVPCVRVALVSGVNTYLGYTRLRVQGSRSHSLCTCRVHRGRDTAGYSPQFPKEYTRHQLGSLQGEC